MTFIYYYATINILMNIVLDKNYNPKIPNKIVYSDQLDEIVDLIIRTQAQNKITAEETALLLKLVLNRELKNDVRSFFQTVFRNEQKTEKFTMFMQLKTNKLNHTS